MEWDIGDCRLVGDLLVVLFTYSQGPRGQQFRNLQAFSKDGRRIWTAEHATSETSDSYVEITSMEPFTAGSFAGYSCQIDARTGRLVQAEFTK
jgi:hypothetical protein